MPITLCEARLCPDCGMEIRCESEEGDTVYYFVQDRQVLSCPQCGLNISYDKLQPAPEPEKTKRRNGSAPAVNKARLISELKEKSPLFDSKADSKRALDSVGEVLFQNLAQGREVIWSDLGRFKMSRYKARKGRNPQNGAEIDIPARTTVRFVPAKKLRDALKNLPDGGESE